MPPELLRAKYAEMLAMRVAHDAGLEDPAVVRAQMAELARRYPGALREIDELEMGEIQARIDALDEAVRGEADRAAWMVAVGLFHAWMRGALCAKRWLAGRKTVDDETERRFTDALRELAFPDEAAAWQGELASVASPPHGKVSALVFARIARELGTTLAQARLLVFGASVR